MEKSIGIIYAPIEIENPGQLESLGITWQDVVPLKVANRVINVYLVPASEEVSRYMLRELRNKYHQEERVKRCKVQGAGRKLVNCIDSISCLDCPHNKNGVEQKPQLVSLDAIMESGWDCESRDSDLQEQLEFGEMLEWIGEVSPLCRTVLTQYLAGYTLEEIAAQLGIPRTNVFRALSKARELACAYRDSSEASSDEEWLDSEPASIGERIRQLRKRKGMTQADLAEALHVTKGTVSTWERECRFPEYWTIQKMCELFGCSLDWLTGRI